MSNWTRVVATPPPPPDARIACAQILAEHFYREGKFELGDTFALEAGIPADSAARLKQPYISMHDILQEVRPGAWHGMEWHGLECRGRRAGELCTGAGHGPG